MLHCTRGMLREAYSRFRFATLEKNGRARRPFSFRRAISERPPHLRAQDPHVGLVVADEAPTWNGGCRLLIHEVARRVLDEEVGEAEVERGIWGERPLCAGCKPGAIFVRQARGTECVLHGRFVEREAPAEFPLRRQLIVGAKPDAPAV